MERLTSSRAKCFRACRRRHHYEYDLCIRPRTEALALSYGTLVHAALEQWWLGVSELQTHGNKDQTLALALAAMEAKLAGMGDDHEVDPHVFASARAMIIGYHHRWWPWALDVAVISVEKQFVCPLINPATGKPSRTFELSGKLDVLATIGGRVWIIEHKSTSSDITPGSPYWQRLRMDGQVSTYYEGATSLGVEVEGCLYDVIKKPSLKPYKATPEEERKYTQGKGCKACGGRAGGKGGALKGTGRIGFGPCVDCNGSGWVEEPRLYANQRTEDETPDEYEARILEKIAENPDAFYQHADVVRTEADLDEFRADLWMQANSIRETKNAGAFARNPDACFMYNRFCPYWDVCCGVTDITDEMRFKQLTTQHPELDGQSAVVED